MNNCSYVQSRSLRRHPDRPDPGAAASRRAGDPDTVGGLADTFRALGDPTRVRILDVLSHGELCVCDLAAVLSLSQSAVSHQLRLLRGLRLVRARREGRMVFYALDDRHVIDLLGRVSSTCARPWPPRCEPRRAPTAERPVSAERARGRRVLRDCVPGPGAAVDGGARPRRRWPAIAAGAPRGRLPARTGHRPAPGLDVAALSGRRRRRQRLPGAARMAIGRAGASSTSMR